MLAFEVEGASPGYEQVLDEVAEAGYRGMKLGEYGFMPIEPEVLRESLDKRGLALVGAFLTVPLVDQGARIDGTEEALRVARLLADLEGETPVLGLSDDYVLKSDTLSENPVHNGLFYRAKRGIWPKTEDSFYGFYCA